MGNQISTATATNVLTSASNAPIKLSLPIEIWFEIFAFVKFHESPNIFLVNRYLLSICQVYFHSGTVGLNKNRNVRDLSMEITKGSLTIFVERNGTWQSVPVPEVDPPKIFNAFGNITIKKCCQIQAMQFLHKFQALLTWENNKIICAHDFFVNNNCLTAYYGRWFWRRNNSNSSIVIDQKQIFLDWIEQKKLSLVLFDPTCKGIARCLANVPLIAQFKGRIFMIFENEKNLCGLEEDEKLIYEWISSADTRKLGIYHYDGQKARELACQIALLFEQAHVNKKNAEKMNLSIFIPEDTVVPMHSQKVCKGSGDQQLSTLRTNTFKGYNGKDIIYYVFSTKPLEYLLYENCEEIELFSRGPEGFIFFE